MLLRFDSNWCCVARLAFSTAILTNYTRTWEEWFCQAKDFRFLKPSFCQQCVCPFPLCTRLSSVCTSCFPDLFEDMWGLLPGPKNFLGQNLYGMSVDRLAKKTCFVKVLSFLKWLGLSQPPPGSWCSVSCMFLGAAKSFWSTQSEFSRRKWTKQIGPFSANSTITTCTTTRIQTHMLLPKKVQTCIAPIAPFSEYPDLCHPTHCSDCSGYSAID